MTGPSAPLLSLPARVSLVNQTTAALRAGLQQGLWAGQLPGERRLAAQLRVSRPTLRAALAQLAREGWLGSVRGRRRPITPPAGDPGRPSVNPALIALLTPHPLDTVPPSALFWMDGLRARLADQGLQLAVVVHRTAYRQRAAGPLAELVRQTPAAAWVLFRSHEPMQRWFAGARIPSLVVGSCPPDHPLPSVDIDYRAVCRHAAARFLGQGHRRVALLLPASGCPGDAESETGFLSAFPADRAEAARVERHDGTTAGLVRRIDRLLAGPTAPTAFLVARSAHALTVLTHLQRRGLQLPRDLALISRDDDPFLAHAVPEVARYRTQPLAFARRVCDAVLQLLQAGPIKARPVRLMPEFYRGQTAG